MMRKLFLVSIAAALSTLFAIGAFAATPDPVCPPSARGSAKTWRIGGMFTYFTNSGARDLVGNGYGVELEHSFGRLWVGDLSGALAYRRFSRDTEGFDNSMNYYSALAKWRTGPGASPNKDGLYYGLGVGVSVINETIRGVGDTAAGAEGLAFGGINFAKSWYGEISYRSPADARSVDTNNLAFELGYRF